MPTHPPSSPQRSAHIAAAALIIAAVLVVFHGLLGGNIIVSSDVGTNDLLYFNYPLGKLYGEALRRGELLQWTPYIYGGFPVFAEGQGGFLYPLNALLWGLLTPVAAMNIYIMLHAVMCGLGMYLFTAAITRSRWVAIPSGVAAAVCGSVLVGHLRHLNPLAVIALTPWLLWTAERFLQRGYLRYAFTFGGIIGLMVLAGHPNFAFIAATVGSLYVLLRRLLNVASSPFDEGATSTLGFFRIALFYGIALVVAVVIALPQLTATIELMQFSRRLSDPTNNFSATHGSLRWNGILTFIYPYYNGAPHDGSLNLNITTPLFYTEGFAYCGVVIFALALVGALWGWVRSGAVRALVIIGVLCYLLALGDNFILHRLMLMLPVVKSFRFPMRWLTGTEMCVLALAGFGTFALARLLARYITHSIVRKPSLGIIVSLIAFADAFLVMGRHVTTDAPEPYLSRSSFEQRLLTREGRGRILSVGKFETHVTAYTTHKGWENDRSLYELHTRLLPPNLCAAHYICGMNGYAILAPNYIYKFWGDAMSGEYYASAVKYNEALDAMTVQPEFLTIARAFGVRYITSPWKMPSPLVQVWDTTDTKTGVGIYAYELPGMFPRAWVVAGTTPVPQDDADAPLQAMTREGFDPATTAIVSGSQPAMPSDAAPGTVDILASTSTTLRLRANTSGLVVLNDSWYPRWEATVDGKAAPVLRVNGMMRGIVAPRAGSVIELSYNSGLLIPMICLSLVTMLGSFAVSFIKPRDARKTEPT